MVFPTIMPANSVSGFNITNSLRFNDGDTAELTRTPGSEGDKQKHTISMWVKRCTIGSNQALFSAGVDGGVVYSIRILSDSLYISQSSNFVKDTNRLFRDPSAWYHIVIAADSTQSTLNDRIKIYINGVLETSFSENTFNGGQNLDFEVNDDVLHAVGYDTINNTLPFDGYIAEFYLIDGAQKAPTDFGETDDNGVWIPKSYTGTYGTNGVHLEFKQTGTGTNASGMGADTSGNNHHFAPVNLAATDVTTDTPTNNFCTLNSVDIDSTLPTLAEGNLDYHSANGTAFNPVRSTMAVTKGKWYAEWKYINTAGFLGVITTQSPLTGNIVSDANVRSILRIPAGLYAGRNNSGGFTDVGDNSQTFSDGDIGQIALDMDNGFVYFGINGTYLKGQDGSTTGDPAGNNGGAGGSANHPSQLMTDQHDGVIAFMAGDYTQNTTGQIQCNFGGGAPFAISSGNADANGHGNFEFAVPSGYFALCTKNLAEYG